MAEEGGDNAALVAAAALGAAMATGEELHAKLCVLNAHAACIAKALPMPHKLSFVLPGQSGAQFQLFSTLAIFLLNKAGRAFVMEKMEDPTALTNRLIAEARALGLELGPDGASPLKYRAGFGDAVVRLLNFLADKALEAVRHVWRPPAAADDIDEEDVMTDETADGLEGGQDDLDEITEANAEGEADADEDAWGAGPVAARPGSSMGGGGSDSKVGGGGGGSSIAGASSSASASAGKRGLPAFLQPVVDADTWRSEVERLAPKLKQAPLSAIPGSAVGKEWRVHLEQTQAAQALVEAAFPDMRAHLERLAADLSELLAAVTSREKTINDMCKTQLKEYAEEAEKQAKAESVVTEAYARITSLTNELASINETLEEVKAAMEEKGSSMTDTSPLIRVKASLSQLRNDIKAMDLHIGVVGHAVMQSKIKHKTDALASSVPADAESGEEDD